MIMREKQCTKCKEIYPATKDYFHQDKSTKDGLNRQCKNCINEYQRVRDQMIKDRLKEQFAIRGE